MQEILHCITLRVVKHSDSTTIVTAWSRERGRVAFAVPAGNGREAQRRRALIMPFSLFEGVATIKPGKELGSIRDVRPYCCSGCRNFNPLKNTIALFLADFLSVVLRENQPDEHLSDFIFDSAIALYEADNAAIPNFHLYFIFRIGHFLGIAPDMGSYGRTKCFDMREGLFVTTPPVHRSYLLPNDARLVQLLSCLTPANLSHLHLSRDLRNQILDVMLDYYSLHHTPMSSLTSLKILRSLFS